MERYLMISDAAKEVQVESHVLRYWEEELHLPIRRNELGHRYYTEGDVELFKQIKSMKEGGLQLKAIKMILKDGKLDVMLPEEENMASEETVIEEQVRQERRTGYTARDTARDTMAIQVIGSRDTEQNPVTRQADDDMRDEKAKRLQWLLQQLIRETLQENNRELCREIKESVVKELDYQFRVQEEREEERDRIREQREEAHYQKLDEMLRKKVKRGKPLPQMQGEQERHKTKELASAAKDSESTAKELEFTAKEAEISAKEEMEKGSGQTVSKEQMANVLSMEQGSKRKKKPRAGKKKFRIFSVESQ